MQVTFNTAANFNNNYKLLNKKQRQNPSFTSVAELPAKSGLLKPFHIGMDKLTDGIAKYYTKFAYESPVAKWLSRREDASQIVNHMQMIGSIVVSGMYMVQTLRNKNMDDDTKKKLSLNQGLTWLVSTLGAYAADNALNKLWDNKVSLKYAKKFLADDSLADKFIKHNQELEKAFRDDVKNAGKKFKPDTVLKYIEKNVKNAALETDLRGLDVLKSLVVFGTIYRFISPVAVTPLANIIGDKIFVKKEEPQTQPQMVLNQPNIANFAAKFKA